MQKIKQVTSKLQETKSLSFVQMILEDIHKASATPLRLKACKFATTIKPASKSFGIQQNPVISNALRHLNSKRSVIRILRHKVGRQSLSAELIVTPQLQELAVDHTMMENNFEIQ